MIQKAICIMCDKCGRVTNYSDPQLIGVRGLRLHYYGMDWEHRGSKDFCPTCADALQTPGKETN